MTVGDWIAIAAIGTTVVLAVFAGLSRNRTENRRQFDGQNKVLGQILEQTTKTNGRVNLVEWRVSTLEAIQQRKDLSKRARETEDPG
jgi:hypothetical protein